MADKKPTNTANGDGDDTASLKKLEYLSLINKITNEIYNHTGMSDKTIAEFVVNLHKESKGYQEFNKKLAEMGGDFPESFVKNLNRLIITMLPKNNNASDGSNSGSEVIKDDKVSMNDQLPDQKANQFPGLAIADDEDYTRNLVVDELRDNGAKTSSPKEKERTSGSSRDHGSSHRSRRREHAEDDDDDRSRSRENRRRRRRRYDRDRSYSKSRSRSNSADKYGRHSRHSHRSRRDRNHSRDRSVSPEYRHRKSSRNRYDDDRELSERRGSHSRSTRNPVTELDDEPIVYKIYDGQVTNIKDFGAFVSLKGVKGQKVEGMVHVSAIRAGERINNPREVLSRGEKVKVKVMSKMGNRMGLSMKDVDQVTGKDLSPQLYPGVSEEDAAGGRPRNGEQSATGSNSITVGGPKAAMTSTGGSNNSRPTIKRIPSPEKWEIKQLIAAGAIDPSEYYGTNLYDNGDGVNNDGGPIFEENEEEVDIEIREDEPLFLRGQTGVSLNLSPIKVVKAPDGSLNRAALSGTALAKERKEIKQQQAQEERENMPKEGDGHWADPLPANAGGNPASVADISGMDAEAAAKQFSAQFKDKDDIPEWKKAIQGKGTTYGKITDLSIKEQRQSLPVYKLRQVFINAVVENQVLVVVGDTGSGKTTQLTQYLYEDGVNGNRRIGCTQPRRMAASSVAKRVSEEVGCRLGAEVGYTIRFEDCTSSDTKIKYLTDGMLMREILLDPELKQYSIIMLDEAHERTVSTDVLFGLLKKTVRRRKDFKLIVTSATLDAEKFSKYFFNCPILTIPGRTYPVQVLYTKDPESDYLEASLVTVMQIHLTEPAGDILLFLTGQEEIETACEILHERMKALGSMVPELIILPVFSALPSEMQSRIFEPTPVGSRKLIIATNIAETSLTIDGIYYVVDPGFTKQMTHDPKTSMDQLMVTPISQAQAKQRSGRAGRTGPGKCYRLYTETAFRNEMLPAPVPEIQRVNLSSTVLTMKAMGINDLVHFDFMDPPPLQTLVKSLHMLYDLGALDEEGLLTRIGRKMAEFPMDAELAKTLLISVELRCSEEMLTIVAMLSIGGTVFYRPRDKQAQADQKKAKFHQPEGDHLTLLTVYNAWKATRFSNQWCHDNYIQSRSLKRAADVRKQMLGIMDRYRQDIISCGGKNFEPVCRAICGGYFRHAAKKDPTEGYKTIVDGTPVYIHPSSSLFNKDPQWVIYHELIMTTKEYMREITAIEPKWLIEAAPTYFKEADANKISRSKRNERLEPLYNKYEAPNSWRISKVKKHSRVSQTF
ncbi:DEAH-box ATP-dependent RNA helicase prp22 [Mycoemilia scoparia]|uniref:RNA helicase n=1 Tax=Mycoemilia scoparia TaxID=417184 RepID=A0A9W7ZUI2_9FUNG|nr:DEAH-box ATP-dependent RNA helicase prp22 [Mycoemilia scoparia]